jgi:hypothetical protein
MQAAGCPLPWSGPQAAPGSASRRPGGPGIAARTSSGLEPVPPMGAGRDAGARNAIHRVPIKVL